MKFHGSIISALQHGSTWAALAGLFAVTANELWPPYVHIAVVAGLVCGVIGILLRAPDQDRDDIRENQQ